MLRVFRRKGSVKGSEKGISRSGLERPLGEYDPLGVHPKCVCLTKVLS